MKSILAFSLTFLLIGCTIGPAPADKTPPELINNPPQIESNLDLGKGVMLYDFSQRERIESPLVLKGVAPRVWFFEGIVPITLLTLEEDIVAESYGTGDWLAPANGSDELGANDPIEFTATIEFTAPPEEVDMGKIRIAQDATGSEETGRTPDFVETMILWP